ncbi:hypothetical protein MLD38_024410 [Melastoma candidum]|uniref:Uncharacterized protein n=1 Tax=Melastoma candidum TaxID=119954 RepID=A0ACB9NUW3_9MYRT|nr:hypothetical protein MLD38_024410 [Melastoma candidum]
MTDLQFQSLFHALDPVCVLSQTLRSDGYHLHLIPEDDVFADAQVEPVTYTFVRGPRYDAYALLRESWLLKKHREQRLAEEIGRMGAPVTGLPPRKQVKFQNTAASRNFGFTKDAKVSNFGESGGVGGRKASWVVAQSVPDFSAVLRKENRRPAAENTLTPPSTKKGSPGMGSGWSAKGSKSAGAAEKRAGCAAARKSYANLEELRGSSVRAANLICSGPGDGKRRILGSRRF